MTTLEQLAHVLRLLAHPPAPTGARAVDRIVTETLESLDGTRVLIELDIRCPEWWKGKDSK
jgi:hypothetical protein